MNDAISSYDVQNVTQNISAKSLMMFKADCQKTARSQPRPSPLKHNEGNHRESKQGLRSRFGTNRGESRAESPHTQKNRDDRGKSRPTDRSSQSQLKGKVVTRPAKQKVDNSELIATLSRFVARAGVAATGSEEGPGKS
jgi:hypothetical protein